MCEQAVVSRPLDCSLCRECIRPAEWDQRVQLSRVKDEFLFTIESTGILSPEELFKEALKVLDHPALIFELCPSHFVQGADQQVHGGCGGVAGGAEG